MIHPEKTDQWRKKLSMKEEATSRRKSIADTKSRDPHLTGG
jgi:hypothetical protein